MSGYTNDCPRLGKWIGGCRYEPRFSLPAYEPQFGIKANGESLIGHHQGLAPARL